MLIKRRQKDIFINRVREISSSSVEFEIKQYEAILCPDLDKLWLITGKYSLSEIFPTISGEPLIIVNEDMKAKVFWGFSYKTGVNIKANGSVKLFFSSHAGLVNLLSKARQDCDLKDLYQNNLRSDFNALLRDCISQILYQKDEVRAVQLEKLFRDLALIRAKSFFGKLGIGLKDFLIRDFQVLN